MPRRPSNSEKSISYAEIGFLAASAFGVTWWAIPQAQGLLMSAEERAAIEGSVTYSGCNEVRALGKAPIYRGEPGYRETMDGDADGVACEPIY